LAGSLEKSKDAYIKAAEMQEKLGSYLFFVFIVNISVNEIKSPLFFKYL